MPFNHDLVDLFTNDEHQLMPEGSDEKTDSLIKVAEALGVNVLTHDSLG